MDHSIPSKYLVPIVLLALTIGVMMGTALSADRSQADPPVSAGPSPELLRRLRATPVPTPTPAPTQTPQAAILTPSPTIPTSTVGSFGSVLTFYVCDSFLIQYEGGFCWNMANGEQVHFGAAACGYAYAMGTRFMIAGDPLGMIWTCKDRGRLAWTGVDIWFQNDVDGIAWRTQLPVYVDVIVVE